MSTFFRSAEEFEEELLRGSDEAETGLAGHRGVDFKVGLGHGLA